MGGKSSTRRVVVEDTGGEDYVTITDAVARRLKGQSDLIDLDKAGGDSPKVTPPQTRTVEAELKPTVLPTTPAQTQKFKEVEDFYVQKLKDLQERNLALQQVTNEQFVKAVKEVEQKFVNVTASPVCQDLQARVLECYQSNPAEILHCSALVSAFTTCVDRARMTVAVSRQQLVH